MLARLLVLWTVSLLSAVAVAAPDAPKLSAGAPLTAENLTVWLISGPDRSSGRRYLTLSEAMEQKKVIVHETDNVNELSVENVSDDVIFIPAGSIVKGGKQDRTLGTDLICTRQDGKMPIDAFCVEQGRWAKRGQESAALFSENSAMVSGKAMKMAANTNTSKADQGRVWQGVAAAQQGLFGGSGGGSGQRMPALESSSSYQLTVESDAVKKLTENRRAAIIDAPRGKTDIVGYVYAVNNKIAGGNVYASPELFQKLWPMLLDAAIVESITEAAPTTQPTAQPALPSTEQVLSALADREQVTRTRELNRRTLVKTYDAKGSILLDTFDQGVPVSRSLLVEPEAP